jgi:hypothetical protein
VADSTSGRPTGHYRGADEIDMAKGLEMERAFQVEFPSHRVTIDDLFGAGDRVVARWTINASHTSGKPVVLHGMTISPAQASALPYSASRRLHARSAAGSL